MTLLYGTALGSLLTTVIMATAADWTPLATLLIGATAAWSRTALWYNGRERRSGAAAPTPARFPIAPSSTSPPREDIVLALISLGARRREAEEWTRTAVVAAVAEGDPTFAGVMRRALTARWQMKTFGVYLWPARS
jgi:hypothetical protein